MRALNVEGEVEPYIITQQLGMNTSNENKSWYGRVIDIEV